jgi:hypothetical protein
MQDEFDQDFKKQFGNFDTQNKVMAKFPTSTSYNRVSTILSENSNLMVSIPITLFHPPAQTAETNAQSGRNKRQRPGLIQVPVDILEDYRRSFQAQNANETTKKSIIEKFWTTVVYEKASEVWKSQLVMNVNENYDSDSFENAIDSKMEFTSLQKRNKKDTWDIDALGAEKA